MLPECSGTPGPSLRARTISADTTTLTVTSVITQLGQMWAMEPASTALVNERLGRIEEYPWTMRRIRALTRRLWAWIARDPHDDPPKYDPFSSARPHGGGSGGAGG